MENKGDVVLITGMIRLIGFIWMIFAIIVLTQLEMVWKKKWKSVGGSGFLGQHIVKQLQENDDDVKEIRIVDLQPYKKKLGEWIVNTMWVCFLIW